VPQQNSDVLTIATKTRLEIDDELTKAFPAKQGAEVVVQTRAGGELRERVEDVVPTGEAGVRARFATAAAAVLGEHQATRLAELVDGLESLADAAVLSRATRPTARAAGHTITKRVPHPKPVAPPKRTAAPKRAAKSKRTPHAKRTSAAPRVRGATRRKASP
jgi:hypothetical protein